MFSKYCFPCLLSENLAQLKIMVKNSTDYNTLMISRGFNYLWHEAMRDCVLWIIHIRENLKETTDRLIIPSIWNQKLFLYTKSNFIVLHFQSINKKLHGDNFNSLFDICQMKIFLPRLISCIRSKFILNNGRVQSFPILCKTAPAFVLNLTMMEPLILCWSDVWPALYNTHSHLLL